ncbi:MAG TPA: VTT domain-containing protein [Ilumatobacter sp.]|nr:VTT domain-containing protein [Ilumatobacter sp.]
MIAALLALLPSWLDPQTIIEKGGLWLVAPIVFAESGLLIGFFLPGDSLLFITGFLASKPEGLPHIGQPLPVVLLVLFIAAVAGDQVGYIFGRSVGPSLFHRPKSRLFNPANVVKAHAFFERHGPKTIVLARFVPIVRTFAPILAGVADMKYRTFTIYNIVGAGLWAVGVTTLGYYLGKVEVVRENVEAAAVIIVALSLIPVVIEVVKHRKEAKKPAEELVSDA